MIFAPKVEYIYSLLEEFAKVILRAFLIRLMKKIWDGMVETPNASIVPLRSRCTQKIFIVFERIWEYHILRF